MKIFQAGIILKAVNKEKLGHICLKKKIGRLRFKQEGRQEQEIVKSFSDNHTINS